MARPFRLRGCSLPLMCRPFRGIGHGCLSGRDRRLGGRDSGLSRCVGCLGRCHGRLSRCHGRLGRRDRRLGGFDSGLSKGDSRLNRNRRSHGGSFSTSKLPAIELAAERQKICSPRRQPWVWNCGQRVSRRAAKPETTSKRCFAPAGAGLLWRSFPMAHAMGYRSFAAPRLRLMFLKTSNLIRAS